MSPDSNRYFLLEIGCEEIPDSMLLPALRYLCQEFVSLAQRERLGLPTLEPDWLGTPRRLALRAAGISGRQEDREVEITGPKVEVAYDARGLPTRALEGFARSQGVALDSLLRVATPRGECLAVRRVQKGRSAVEVLGSVLASLIASIPFGKTMRWGAGSFRFARPIQWVVCLHGEEVVPFEVAGIPSGRVSRGPRFEGSPAIEIPDARDYVTLLQSHLVLADWSARRVRIRELVEQECARLGHGYATEERPELLDTLTGLVEHPVAAAGNFDASFLSLPGPVLSTAMIHHQRFLPVRSERGTPVSHYVAILNCRPDPLTVDRIRRGNEWVLQARLKDADFFWKEDRKRTQEDRVQDLERVLFEATLGSYRRKVDRLARLAEALCGDLRSRGHDVDTPSVLEAARICKSDLTTLMVKEFPELQGIMGSLYARLEGKPEPVCRALEQQYRGAGEAEQRERFSTLEGAALAITDRMDTLTGFFLLDRIPTGSKDPFGLRRSALAVVQAALDLRIHFSISGVIRRAVALYEEQGIRGKGDGSSRLVPFLEERLRHVCQQALGLRYDAVNAALAVGADDILDAVLRAQALHAIRGHADFEALSLSFRRVRNILAEEEVEPLTVPTLPLKEERALLKALEKAERDAGPLLGSGDYSMALQVLAGIRSPLDRFFETVLVMDPDPAVRKSRLGLLKRISLLLLRVGDFAEMVLEGEGAQLTSGVAKRG
ncbi:MAG: glycine--tRNA ligase subunit beta [Acidobacteria bacterium]|nr:MAG: glycine--tRNA ligase subunit beta [Acidobacteriota bacterium]